LCQGSIIARRKKEGRLKIRRKNKILTNKRRISKNKVTSFGFEIMIFDKRRNELRAEIEQHKTQPAACC
jgi:hypothetical protein